MSQGATPTTEHEMTTLTLNITAASQIAEVDTTVNKVATRTAEKIEALGFDVDWKRHTKTEQVGHVVKTHRNAVGFTKFSTVKATHWFLTVSDADTCEELGCVTFVEGADGKVGNWGFSNGMKARLTA